MEILGKREQKNSRANTSLGDGGRCIKSDNWNMKNEYLKWRKHLKIADFGGLLLRVKCFVYISMVWMVLNDGCTGKMVTISNCFGLETKIMELNVQNHVN